MSKICLSLIMITFAKLFLFVLYDLVFISAPTSANNTSSAPTIGNNISSAPKLSNNTSSQNDYIASSETVADAKEQYFENFLDLGEIELTTSGINVLDYSGLDIQQRAILNLATMTDTQPQCYTVMPSNINISAVSLLRFININIATLCTYLFVI